jgi:hypothetical protein
MMVYKYFDFILDPMDVSSCVSMPLVGTLYTYSFCYEYVENGIKIDRSEKNAGSPILGLV